MRPFLILIGMLGGAVVIEPAPIDIVILATFTALIVFSAVKISVDVGLCLICLSMFGAINVLGVTWSQNVDHALFYSAVTLFLAISWFTYLQIGLRFGVAGIEQVLIGQAAVGVTSIILSVLALLGVLPTLAETILYGVRLKGFFKDPNVFAPFLVVSALYSVGKWLDARGIARFSWLAVCVVLFAGIVLAASRAAWGNAAVALAIFLFITLRGQGGAIRKLVVLLGTVCIALAAVVYVLGIQDETEEQVSSLVERIGLQDYDAERFMSQRRAIDTSLENLAGIGPGQTSVVATLAPHNVMIQVMAENGILGLAALLGFVLISLGVVLRSIVMFACTKTEAAIHGATIGTLLNGLFVDTLHWRHLWLLMAFSVAVALLRLSNSTKRNPYNKTKVESSVLESVRVSPK